MPKRPITLSGREAENLQEMGANLRSFRKFIYRESREDFALRLQVSATTLRSMEAGQPGVAIGHWMSALKLMQVSCDVVRLTKNDSVVLAEMTEQALKNGFPKTTD